MKTSQFLKKRGSLLLSTLLITTLIVPLSTVGFVSFHGYAKDAKAATTREYISILSSTVNMQAASGNDVSTFIDTTTTDKTVRVSQQKTIFGKSDMTGLITKAGNVQWDSISSLNKDETKDAYGHYPLIGYASTSQNAALQVATTIDDQIYVKGNFTPDSGENAAKGLIQNPSGASELVDGDYGKHR